MMSTMNNFVKYGPSHIIALLFMFALGVGLYFLGRKIHNGQISRNLVEKTLGSLIAANIVLVYGYEFIFNFDINTAMPFQICDWAWITSAVIFFRRNKFMMDCLFFWGLSFNIIAMLTPVLPTDFPSPRFIVFWFCHGGILIASLYTIFGWHHVPNYKDALKVMALTSSLAFIIYWFNLYAGTNYVFVSHKPVGGSPLDLLSPWPYYNFQVALIFLIIWFFMSFLGQAFQRWKT